MILLHNNNTMLTALKVPKIEVFIQYLKVISQVYIEGPTPTAFDLDNSTTVSKSRC